jgi:hypothetical protein
MATNGNQQRPARTASFGLSHDPFGRLMLIDADGVRHVGVDPIRAFPLSMPERFISLCDEHGHEIVCVDHLSDLPPNVRCVLEAELAEREFVPVIARIVRVTGDGGPASEWSVETDRGATRFTVDGEDDIRTLSPTRAIITDSSGVRYLVADSRALDGASRRVLERFL